MCLGVGSNGGSNETDPLESKRIKLVNRTVAELVRFGNTFVKVVFDLESAATKCLALFTPRECTEP